MADILAKVTDDYRLFLAQLTTTVITGWDPTPTHFKVGEGGWVDFGAGAQQRAPVSDLRRFTAPLIPDLDAVVDTTRAFLDKRYPAGGTGAFQKAFVPGDYFYVAPSTARYRCFLDFGEFNDDGFGNSPEIWEIGLFCTHPVIGGQKLMVAYGTMVTGFIKNGGVQLNRFLKVVY